MRQNQGPGVPPLLIMGLGNVLLKDEGVGIHVIQRLQQIPLPPHLEIIEGGTLGIDLLWYLLGRKKVILIDAVQAGEKPGTIFRFCPEDIQQVCREENFSLHQLGLFDALNIAKLLNQPLPEIVIIAIQPKNITQGMEISQEIEASMPVLIDMVLKEIV